jgi:hypothetical protein
MPPIIAPALRLLPALPVDGEPIAPCTGAHAHLDRAVELRAWSIERRQKALRAERKHADELKAAAKVDARALCVSLVTQGLLLMADDHIAKAVKCFRSRLFGFSQRRLAHHRRPRAALHHALRARPREPGAVRRVSRARQSRPGARRRRQRSALDAARRRRAGGAGERGVDAGAVPAATCTCIAAQTQLLLGQHASLSDEPASSAALLTAALRHVCGDGDDATPAPGCAALAQCAASRWSVIATVALAMGKTALRGFDIEAARLAVTYAEAVARRSATRRCSPTLR